tara:strand:- start:152 stop:427 length:276 start_codon:yes stop_codon:yes gene_type:complete
VLLYLLVLSALTYHAIKNLKRSEKIKLKPNQSKVFILSPQKISHKKIIKKESTANKKLNKKTLPQVPLMLALSLKMMMVLVPFIEHKCWAV